MSSIKRLDFEANGPTKDSNKLPSISFFDCKIWKKFYILFKDGQIKTDNRVLKLAPQAQEKWTNLQMIRR